MMYKKHFSRKSVGEIFTVYKPRQIAKLTKCSNLPKYNFHRCLKWILLVAQCFGQIPVIGITDASARSLQFKWKSWRTLYALFNCIGALCLTSRFLGNMVINGVDIFSSTSIAFHVNTMIVTFLFLNLAKKWPQLMNKWADVEDSMSSYGWPKYLHIRINATVVVVLIVATIETLIVKVHKLMTADANRKDISIFEYYITVMKYPHVFEYMNYSIWWAIPMQIQNILMTFAWTFNDLFLVVISTGLAARFQQVTAKLRVLKNSKNTSIADWREIREDYNRLSQLTKIVDDALSFTILASYSNNLFFILVQLFNSLRSMKETLEKVYFFFSFGFIIIRTVSVSMYGAWIYDESKEPTAILNSVSSDIYNTEIKRFVDQIKFDTVALSGKHFFYITRGLILSMAGAIVTYELVLIQFNVNLLQDSTSESV